MLEWPIALQLILQGGSLGILALFLLLIFPKMHEKTVNKIAGAQLQAGEMFFRAMELERETLGNTLKDTATAIRENTARLDRLASQAVCKYQHKGRNVNMGPGES